MKIKPELIEDIAEKDPETYLFLKNFDEPEGSKILEVGAHDSAIASLLANLGYCVTGVDLRECDQSSHPNYTHIVGDFCNLSDEFLKKNIGTFDSAISVSSIEHFGLGTYTEEYNKNYYDVLASRYVYNLIKKNGTFYIVIPISGKYMEIHPHWRVYDFFNFKERIIQDFVVEDIQLQASENFHLVSQEYSLINRKYKANEPIDMFSLVFSTNGFPGISIFAKLKKG